MSRKVGFPVISAFLTVLILGGCFNPFAPREGEVGDDIWDTQTTVGGLLRNFQTSYELRDSLRYSDLIAPEFEFHYYVVEESRYDYWGRDQELKTTGGMMRTFDRLDLRWGPWSAAIDTFSMPDTTIEFTVNFSLTAGNFNPLSGFARFRARSGEDHKFRLTLWRDDY